jgi:phospholipid-binding lipoprotein MlaA
VAKWLRNVRYLFNLLLSCTLAFNLIGCASSLENNPDPYEPFNRKVFAFNQVTDDLVLKPVAMCYRGFFPRFMRQGVDNFFTNVSDTTVIVNDILQFKMRKTGNDVTRLVINTTVGLAGFLDVASSWGFRRVPLTFGDTLSVYGWENSAYLVLPFWGASTIRDTVGMAPDWYFSAWGYVEPEGVRLSLFGLYAINSRANYLDMEGLIKVASFDDYVLLRDVYLQRREARLHNESTGIESEF